MKIDKRKCQKWQKKQNIKKSLKKFKLTKKMAEKKSKLAKKWQKKSKLTKNGKKSKLTKKWKKVKTDKICQF